MTTIVPLDKDYKDLEGAVTVDYDSRNQLVKMDLNAATIVS